MKLLGKIYRRLVRYYQLISSLLVIRYLAKMRTRRVFLMGTPWYGNVGDQAIAMAERYALTKVYPGFTVIEVPQDVIRSRLTRHFSLGVKTSDVLYLQGGGNLGSLYVGEEELRRTIIERYAANRLVIMPVSIFFHEDEMGRRELALSKAIYASARDLTIIARDEQSFAFASREFTTAQNVLAPDIVTTMAEMKLPMLERKGILFFLRSDKERVRDDSVIVALMALADKLGLECRRADNLVVDPVYTGERERVVREKISAIASSRLVVTDRFHGLIFAVITRTPVIVLKSYDTKIASGVRWFSSLPWVYYGDAGDQTAMLSKMREYLASGYVVTEVSDCGAKIITALKNTCRK